MANVAMAGKCGVINLAYPENESNGENDKPVIMAANINNENG
jgi:hypothetical protein